MTMPATLEATPSTQPRVIRLIRAALPSRIAALAIVLVGIAAAAVTFAAAHYGPTIDEGAHIAAGMQWLDQGRYAYEPSTPPLARVADALGPYLAGARSTFNPDMWHEGDDILRASSNPAGMLALARLGTLAFLLLAASVIWRWSRRLGDELTGLCALALFLTLPPILAHAGLATTDMAVAATFGLAILAAIRWLERPDLGRSLALGAAGALMILSKFTVFLFFPAALLPVLTWRLWIDGHKRWPARIWIYGTAFATLAAVMVIWGGYRFSVGSLGYEPALVGQQIAATAAHPATGLAASIAKLPVYPAHEFFRGIFDTSRRVDAHHDPVFLLGHLSQGGLWYFFPVDLLAKTPLPFLIAAALGIVMLLQRSRALRDWRIAAPALAAIGVLAGSMASPVDFGIRYLLPIYPLLAIAAGTALLTLARGKGWDKVTACVLLLWAGADAVTAYPDYLPWFNALAGATPQTVSINSDLDWGQDVKRLDQDVRALGIHHIHVAVLEQSEYDLRAYIAGYDKLLPGTPVGGWIAVSQYMLHEQPGYAWLRAYAPVATVGASILLYHLPENANE
ncbi:MAG: glycosyltransferase family 39 protein [Alphaproteobacteria bacterium]|nr:glycosyltransferase family 39 protein [Alphaproteobacteria bacterium]